jgi:hypothetical protein
MKGYRRPGRPGRSRHEAAEFGRLVELELTKTGVAKVEAAMEIVRRQRPRRWGGRSKAFELWSEYKTAKAYRAESDRQYAQMIAEVSAKLSADPKTQRRLFRWLRRQALAAVRQDEQWAAQWICALAAKRQLSPWRARRLLLSLRWRAVKKRLDIRLFVVTRFFRRRQDLPDTKPGFPD